MKKKQVNFLLFVVIKNIKLNSFKPHDHQPSTKQQQNKPLIQKKRNCNMVAIKKNFLTTGKHVISLFLC